MEEVNDLMLVGVVAGIAFTANLIFGTGGVASKATEAVKQIVEDVSTLGCADNEQYDAGLCYDKCKEGYDGVGPICWATCGADWSEKGGSDIGAYCEKNSYGRGVGDAVSACEPGWERQGLLCYEKCAAGYSGVGPVCWENCQPGYTDDGVTCRKDSHVIPSDNSGCPWYDKCGLVSAKGCSKCPEGYKNDGCTCRIDVHVYGKKTRTRPSKVMICPYDKEGQAGLCYTKCRKGYYGVGPVCWMTCPTESSDIGISCEKKNYSRGVGRAIHH